MGGYLVTKLVKPIKTVCSWTPHQGDVGQLLLPKTEAHIRAAAAGILGKTNATVRQKVCRLDAADCSFHQTAKLLSLFVGDGRVQVLNLNQALADEYDLGDLSNTSHPRVADGLGIQRKQSLRYFRVSARTGLPLQQAARPVEFADGIDVGDEVFRFANRPRELDLQIMSRPADLDTIVLAEPGQEHDSLSKHTIPGVSVGVMQALTLTDRPLVEQNCPGIFPAKKGSQGSFEGAADSMAARVSFS